MAITYVPPDSTVGYLGPAGTFSEQALLTQPDLANAKSVPVASFADILFAVNDGELDYGFVAVESGQDMATAVGEVVAAGTDWLLMAAAVADFAPANPTTGKLKKEDLGTGWQLAMTRNPDILAEVVPAKRQPGLKVVGFALETEDVQARALGKLQAKNMDYVVANNPTERGSGFGAENHRVQLLAAGGMIWQSESRPKSELASALLAHLARSETS